MELKEFIENFKEVFDDEDLTGINGDTFFKELDVWSSLSALSLIAMADENENPYVGSPEFYIRFDLGLGQRNIDMSG